MEKFLPLLEDTSMPDNTKQAPSASAAELVPLSDVELDAVAGGLLNFYTQSGQSGGANTFFQLL